MRSSLLAIVGTALFLAAASATAGAASPPASCAATPPGSLIPLTATECAEATRIVAASGYLRELLAGIPHSASKPVPWGGDTRSNLGAVVTVQLDRPLTVKRTAIPVAAFPPGGSTVYVATHTQVSIAGATSLLVFVDLHRYAVVWVMPQPHDSEGPPPASVPAFTLPAGFTPGTGGATPADAATGLIMGAASFDSSGRQVDVSWFDPVTGISRTTYFGPTGKPFVVFSTELHKTTATWITVSDFSHQWSKATLPLDDAGSVPLILDSRTLPASMQELSARQLATPVGQDTVYGATTAHLHGRLGFVVGSFWFSGPTGDLWLDPTTSLPIKETIVNGSGSATTIFTWLPRSAVGPTTARLVAPPGYKQVPIKTLPPPPFGSGE